jgi:hypothetical protein
MAKGLCRRHYMRGYMREYQKRAKVRALKNKKKRDETARRRSARPPRPEKVKLPHGSLKYQKPGTYYSRNRKRILEKCFVRSLARCGLTLDSYNALLQKQGGVCAICKQAPGKKRMAIDHDHKCCPGDRSCGFCVRGLLHDVCNRALGMFQDDVKRLAAAIEYLR